MDVEAPSGRPLHRRKRLTQQGTRNGLRRLRVATAVLLVLGACAALPSLASAQFGIVRYQVTIQGSGSTVATGGTTCSRLDNLDDRRSVVCPPAVAAVLADPPTITATPNPSPPGHWRVVSCGGIRAATCPIPLNVAAARVKVVFADVRAPTVTPGVPTFSTARDRTVRLAGLSANEPASLECRVGSTEPFRPCTSATEFTLPEGPNVLQVRGTDRSGNSSDAISTAAFQVLDTRLVSGPPPVSRTGSASFRFSTLTGFSFDCALDGAPLADCGNKLGDNTLTKSFSGLQQGTHTFTVRARNGGLIDHVPVRHTWTVDTIPPETGLDPLVGPRDGEVSTLLSAAFSMTTSEPATLQCRLDGAAFAACPASTSFASLGFGQHRFEARAIDRAGNVDATPITRTWTVLAVDNDGDGFNQRSDCNDAEPLIRPGAREIAGNDVDENCDNFRAPPPRMSSTTVLNSWSVLGKRATLTRLQVKRLRSGARVEVRCLGRRCAFGRVRVKGKRGTLNVLKSLRPKQRRLRAGQTLEIRLTAPRVIGKVVRFKIRAGKIPRARELCLPPGARRPTRCG